MIPLRRALRIPFSKKKRVRELSDAKISILPNLQPVVPEGREEGWSYSELRGHLVSLGWESMGFDRLCALPPASLQAIQIETKKDKFNVDDEQFYEYGSQLSPSQTPSLSPYYQRLRALLCNDHSDYDRLRPSHQSSSSPKYKAQLYIYDLEKDPQLRAIVTHFVNHLQFPQQLEAIAEPTLVKKLLAAKRELMIQGVRFETRGEVKQNRKEERKIRKEGRTLGEGLEAKGAPLDQEDLDQENLGHEEEEEGSEVERQARLSTRLSSLLQSMDKYSNQVELLEVLGYEYEFWVDVKHNRSKNGHSEDYVVQEREIDHPNSSLLLSKHSPRIRVKYLVHKRKRKEHCMHFCSKAELLIRVNQHRRIIKIEWNGPSSQTTRPLDPDFRVIDYEHLMDGNPTIQNVFRF